MTDQPPTERKPGHGFGFYVAIAAAVVLMLYLPLILIFLEGHFFGTTHMETFSYNIGLGYILEPFYFWTVYRWLPW